MYKIFVVMLLYLCKIRCNIKYNLCECVEGCAFKSEQYEWF